MKRLAWPALATMLSLVAISSAAAPIAVKNYGQQLVDEAIAADPGILVAMMHVKPPESPDNIIVASNIGRLGKLADEDDQRVIDTGKSNLEIATGGTRFEVELVLQDVAGETVGALGLVFAYKDGDDKLALERRAQHIRDAMRRRIADAANLVDPYPMDPAVTTKTHAAKLVTQVLERHPEVLIVALHVAPPGKGESIVLASNVGRLGMKVGDDDAAALRAGPVVRLGPPVRGRVEARTALLDSSGRPVGVLAVVLPEKTRAGEASNEIKVGHIRDELREQIHSLEKLCALDP